MCSLISASLIIPTKWGCGDAHTLSSPPYTLWSITHTHLSFLIFRLIKKQKLYLSILGGGVPSAGPSSEYLYNGTGVGGGFPPQNALNLPPFPLANRANKRPRLNVNVPTPLLSNGGMMSSADNGMCMFILFFLH